MPNLIGYKPRRSLRPTRFVEVVGSFSMGREDIIQQNQKHYTENQKPVEKACANFTFR